MADDVTVWWNVGYVPTAIAHLLLLSRGACTPLHCSCALLFGAADSLILRGSMNQRIFASNSLDGLPPKLVLPGSLEKYCIAKIHRVSGYAIVRSLCCLKDIRGGYKMKMLLTVVGIIALVLGLLFVGQGLGYIQWPAESFMISQVRWAYYGGGIAVIGIVLIVIARM